MAVDTHCYTSLLCSSMHIDNDSSLYKISCHWFSVQFLCDLANLSLSSLFFFLKNGFLSATLSLRQRLIRLQWTVHGPTEGPDASLMSCVKSLNHFSVFLKNMTFRYWTSAVDQFLSLLHLPLTSFHRFLWGYSAYHAKIRLPSFQLIALGIYLVKILIHVFNTMLSLVLMWQAASNKASKAWSVFFAWMGSRVRRSVLSGLTNNRCILQKMVS